MQPCQGSDCLTGGRRVGGERRSYAYAVHIPERRSGTDRRSGKDRRRYPRVTPGKLAVDGPGMYEPIQAATGTKG